MHDNRWEGEKEQEKEKEDKTKREEKGKKKKEMVKEAAPPTTEKVRGSAASYYIVFISVDVAVMASNIYLAVEQNLKDM